MPHGACHPHFHLGQAEIWSISMVTFSANLGFLWADLPLPAAIRAAKAAGFGAVECHWPYATPPTEITAALKDTGLEMLGLNTPKSAGSIGLFGLSALPGHEALARSVIDQSLSFADDIGARSLHVMAGMVSGAEAQASFCAALSHACHQAQQGGMTILIEPLNRYDAPGYFLNSLAQAEEIITSVNHPNLKLMFDCYHVGRTEGDVIAQLQARLPLIGHIQFASIPNRKSPDQGTLDYTEVFAALDKLGWNRPLGAEYHPDGATGNSLDWMNKYKPKPSV
jgi:2-dehydrotetronate isomerase